MSAYNQELPGNPGLVREVSAGNDDDADAASKHLRPA